MHTKATIASATKDIALNKLKPSPANVRRTGTEVGLEEFAASIAAHGLLQPLVVEPERNGEGEETGWYLVTAGERRRKALRILAKQKRIKRNEPIPCLIKADGIASEISLAENVIRTSMHPADQFEAFQKLIDEGGLGIEEIAARFSVTPAVVKQRLKLAAVSPTLMTRYREGELTLDQLMAFTLTDDHGRQEEVWAQLSWNKSPEMIRKLLTQSHVSPSDRRANSSAPKRTRPAGGIILRDLFVEDHGGYYTDSQLLDRLVLEKLEATGEEVSREGWKWVAVYPEYPYTFVHTLRRIYPQSVPLSEEESAKLDELVTRHDALITEHGEELPRRSVQSSTAWPKRSPRSTAAPNILSRRSISSRCDRLFELRRRAPHRARVHQARRRGAALSIGRSGRAWRRPTDVAGSHWNHDHAKRRRAGEREAPVQPAHRTADRRAHRGAAGVPGREARGGVEGGRACPRAPRLLSSGVPGRHLPWARGEDRGAGHVRAERERKPGGAISRPPA